MGVFPYLNGWVCNVSISAHPKYVYLNKFPFVCGGGMYVCVYIVLSWKLPRLHTIQLEIQVPPPPPGTYTINPSYVAGVEEHACTVKHNVCKHHVFIDNGLKQTEGAIFPHFISVG